MEWALDEEGLSLYNLVVSRENPPLQTSDPSERPRYTIPEAAHYLRMSRGTLKSWVAGRSYPVVSGQRYWEGLIRRPDPADSRLSFSNLIEAHVLNALRTQYRVKMPAVRTALEYAKGALGVDRVLLSQELRVTTGNVFLEHLGKLINVSRAGQEAMPEILAAYLARVEWDPAGLPSRMFPLTRDDHPEGPRLVAIDPRIAFGRPIVDRKAIKTSVIAGRFQAGESIRDIAEDYDLEAFEVEEAIRYEALPAAA
jgi:uncharacterized protein (DUF433 family)